ncbi:TetR/AcrR family transcriptional regulator [Streptomyces aidingensis]|uniref:Regulatory protein, tetR family n=1 Tax=Streptomyces aidingensis TaxID=910347 RepID=A0A1I1TWW0_9ACTN|nr:helix-turn-helix domain-containing protein [Streptomyces aidingensis]SFD63052.1 regulatory protein, tetR family [Streptomyces aidingensis]
MPLRTDARRNLRHVLSAARDVFGEQGYDAPIEEVARRARVGVGTVYRRFPTKEALVQYIVEEETRRLTDRALEALAGEGEPWRALEGFVRFSAASGTSRLLPELLAAAAEGAPASAVVAGAGTGAGAGAGAGGAGEGGGGRLPRQRGGLPLRDAPGTAAPATATSTAMAAVRPAETRALLDAMGQLVERTRAAGQLRPDVTVADIMLVITTAPPSLGDPERQSEVASRLLEILLQGLRPVRP